MYLIKTLSKLLWKIIKIEIFVGALAGMLFSEIIDKEVYKYFIEMDILEKSIFLTVVSFFNWEKFSIILLLVIVFIQSNEINKQKIDLAQIKIGIVTILDYFKLNSKVKIPHDTYEGHISEYYVPHVIDDIIGGEKDCSLKSKATRNRNEVNFFSDTSEILRKAQHELNKSD